MRIDILTLFPGIFAGPLDHSILARAQEAGRLRVEVHDLREFAPGKHRVTDEPPFGGGGGMVMKPEPIFRGVDSIRERFGHGTTILLSPQGNLLTHDLARELSAEDHLILICGRYEGIDERVRLGLADREVSVGDLVVTGGELPALILIDAVSRFVPGVLGRSEAAEQDSFAEGRLDSPYYTRPPEFRGMRVPEVLLSGDHAAVARWREDQAREATKTKRPDLIERGGS